MDCRLISRGRKQADCAAAYTEPCFMPSAGHPWQEEGVLYFLNPEKKLLYKEEIHASDCTTPFPFREAEQPTVELDNTLDIHPYYVRFAGDSRGWLDIVTAERRGSGIITRPVSVKAMHNWAKHARRDDPHLFFARWENG